MWFDLVWFEFVTLYLLLVILLVVWLLLLGSECVLVIVSLGALQVVLYWLCLRVVVWVCYCLLF